ncbi:MAG: hypothetical protein HQ527_06375 [Cyanobacteria bacterium]|nr:hypothetical protein [Cyanobacteria bacterium bin.51]
MAPKPLPLPLRLLKALLNFIMVPLRAPLLLLLLAVSVYLGMHWSRLDTPAGSMRWSLSYARQIYWSLECFQAVLVVVVCTMPDLLMRQLTALMATSRVMTLVLTLLLVTIAALYLLRLSVLADMVILATSVLLARLDLTRIRIVPPPLPTAIALSAYVMLGVWLGRLWHLSAQA